MKWGFLKEVCRKFAYQASVIKKTHEVVTGSGDAVLKENQTVYVSNEGSKQADVQ